jgi:hypothetical protein
VFYSDQIFKKGVLQEMGLATRGVFSSDFALLFCFSYHSAMSFMAAFLFFSASD